MTSDLDLEYSNFRLIHILYSMEQTTFASAIMVSEVNDMQKQKLVEEKRDNKVGDEWEIAERSELQSNPPGGNSMAQVDRASTYSDPDKDKQFKQKRSDVQASEGRDE